MIRLSSFPRYLAWPGAPSVAQRPREPSVSVGHRPSVKSRSPLLGHRLWPHTPFHLPPTPPCYLGTEKRRKTTSLVLRPLLPSSTSPIIWQKRRHSLRTLSQPPVPPCAAARAPRVFAGPGWDAGETSTGNTQGGNQPWETHGPREEKRLQRVSLQKPRTWAHPGRKHTGARDAPRPGPLVLPPRRARAPRAPPGCAPAAPAPLSARRATRAVLLRRQLWGFFVYIRAHWQTLRGRVCHGRAINFHTGVRFPGQPR